MITAYKGVGPEHGRRIPAERALAYAMERCGIRPSAAPADQREKDDFAHMLIEWYFSGNWIPVEQAEEEADPWAS